MKNTFFLRFFLSNFFEARWLFMRSQCGQAICSISQRRVQRAPGHTIQALSLPGGASEFHNEDINNLWTYYLQKCQKETIVPAKFAKKKFEK